MANPKSFVDPEGDENNDDTFGSSMSGIGTLELRNSVLKVARITDGEKLPAQSLISAP